MLTMYVQKAFIAFSVRSYACISYENTLCCSIGNRGKSNHMQNTKWVIRLTGITLSSTLRPRLRLSLLLYLTTKRLDLRSYMVNRTKPAIELCCEQDAVLFANKKRYMSTLSETQSLRCSCSSCST